MLPACPPPQEGPPCCTPLCSRGSGQHCVTSGVKVVVTVNGAPKSQPAAHCLFPARDPDKLISSIPVCSSRRAGPKAWLSLRGCRKHREWHKFLAGGTRAESALFSTWGTPTPCQVPCPPQLPLWPLAHTTPPPPVPTIPMELCPLPGTESSKPAVHPWADHIPSLSFGLLIGKPR